MHTFYTDVFVATARNDMCHGCASSGGWLYADQLACSDKVLHLVRLSDCVCPLTTTVYSKSGICKNFKFIGDIMQDTSNWDSRRFDDWMTIRCKFIKKCL